MSRLAIECKARPEPPRESGVHLQMRRSFASFTDCFVWLVDDDGTRHAITNLTSIQWTCKQGQISLATLEFDDVDVDVVAELDELVGPPGAEATP